jgi:hypothetical protein
MRRLETSRCTDIIPMAFSRAEMHAAILSAGRDASQGPCIFNSVIHTNCRERYAQLEAMSRILPSFVPNDLASTTLDQQGLRMHSLGVRHHPDHESTPDHQSIRGCRAPSDPSGHHDPRIFRRLNASRIESTRTAHILQLQPNCNYHALEKVFADP